MIKDIHHSDPQEAADALTNWRCIFNGADITKQTFYADDEKGIVRVLLLRDGHPYTDDETGLPATAEWQGKVELVRK